MPSPYGSLRYTTETSLPLGFRTYDLTASASARAWSESGGTARKTVCLSLIVRRRGLVACGQRRMCFWIVRPWAMAIASGGIVGPGGHDAPPDTGGPAARGAAVASPRAAAQT